MIETQRLFAEGPSPLLVTPSSGSPDLAVIARERSVQIDDMLREHGAVLFRGFDVRSPACFAAFTAAVSEEALDYVYGSTPRTSVGDRVFTASEYPASQEIPLHNENSYHRSWPLRIAFCALVVAASGGETPIAPMDRVTASIPPDVLARFETRGVEYVRHYHEGVDIPWQQVFRTESREEIRNYCRREGISAVWLEDDVLRTSGVCQGVARHPRTGEIVFFNQAHLFHSSSLGGEEREMLQEVFGDQLPRHARYGDGSEITTGELEAVRAAFRANEIVFQWRRGDALLLDNMQWAHGRRSYTGERLVLAALMNASVAVVAEPARA
jgi:alpha-ketoglutarate-dependent taurine dioxygenase